MMDRPVSIVALCTDRGVADLVRAAFPAPRFYLVVRATADDAQSLLKAVNFDAALLHWDAENPRSLEILHQLKTEARIPVCILSGVGAHHMREAAIALGVDEVLPISCRPEQLRFCLHLMLQREGVAHPGPCEFGRLSINPMTCAVRWRGLEIRLGRVELRLLELMLKHHREVLSREFILGALWPNGGYKSSRLVDAHVSSLRRAFLRDAQIKPIQTVPGVGYRLRISSSASAA